MLVDCTVIVYYSRNKGKVYKLIMSKNFKFEKMDLSSDDNFEFLIRCSR